VDKKDLLDSSNNKFNLKVCVVSIIYKTLNLSSICSIHRDHQNIFAQHYAWDYIRFAPNFWTAYFSGHINFVFRIFDKKNEVLLKYINVRQDVFPVR
jgi:hypothetical protein